MATLSDLERQFNEHEYERYMADVLEKNTERRTRNLAYRNINPQQPSLSQQADDARQLHALKKSDKAQSLEDLEAGYTDSLEQEVQTSPAPVKPSSPVDAPHWEARSYLNPEGGPPLPGPMENSPLSRTVGPYIKQVPGLETGLDYLAMPGDYLRGVLSGQPGERVDPYTFTGADPNTMSRLQGAIRGGAGMLVDPLMVLGPLAGGLVRGLRSARSPLTIPPVEVPVGEIDPTVAGRSPKVVSGEPDSVPLGPRTQETGRVLAVPSLELGSQTNTVPAISARTGHPMKTSIPGLSPGEVGSEVEIPYRLESPFEGEAQTGQQTMLIPEVPSGVTSSTGGKRILQPEEQLGIGEQPLRPQVLRHPGIPEKKVLPNTPGSGIEDTEYPGLSSTAEAVKPLTETLQKISKREVWKQHLRDSLVPEQDYRLTLQTSPRGSVSVIEAERDSGLRYRHIPNAPSDIPLVFPGWPSRVTQSIIDTLHQVGPEGVNIGTSIHNVLSNRAVLTSNDVINTTNQLKQVAGVRGLPSKVIEGFRELSHGENAFIWGTHRYFKLSEAEVEQVWNYMYTGGKQVPQSTKARTFGDQLYQGMLLKPSQAAHEVDLQLYNPLTGKHQPFGAPSMFMPQIPTKPIAISGVSDTHLELLYNKQGGLEGTGKSFPLWKSQLSRILSQGGELREAKAAEAGMTESAIRYDMASKKYKGLEVTRLLDLEALGGSPYQWAKKLGYETDPFRAAFRYNSSAYLRTEWARALPQIEKDMAGIAERGGTDLTEWAAKAIERSQGIHTGLTETRLLRQLVKGVRDYNNVSMLQLGGLGSTPQLGYALGRAPLTRSMLGAVDFVVGRNRDLVEKSGAVFPTVMNLITQPEGPLATVSTGALRLYGISALDKWSRYFGGHVGVQYADFLEKALLKYPQKERLHDLVKEMGGDVKTILKAGHIPQDMKLAMIQRYANYVAGVPDARGLPLIATNETAYWRLANQYRSFMFSNQAELVRLWKQAPTWHDAINRVTKVLLGTGATAATTGAVSEFIRNAFTEESDGSPFVNKRLKKIVGDEGAAFAIQTLTYGLGALFGSLALTSLDSGWKLAAQITGGPTAGLIAGTAEDVVDSIIYGPSWKSVRTQARRVPFVGPLLAPIVQDQIAEDRRQEQVREKLRRALMPQSGFENEP